MTLAKGRQKWGGAGCFYFRVIEVALSEAAQMPFPDMANPAAHLSAVRETMEVLFEISKILNTGLDMETLSICVRLCEQGINPEALSAVIKELRKATETLKAAENMTS